MSIRKSIPAAALALAGGVATAGPAGASSIGIEEFMGFQDLSYSGYARYQAWDMAIEGPINRAPGEMRFAFEQQDVDFVALVQRGDEDVVLMLPDHAQYTRMEADSSDAMTFVPRPEHYQSANISPEGWDQLDGRSVVRSRIEGVDEQGRIFDGVLWNAPDGALLRAVINVGDRDRAITYQLSDYDPGPQRISIFLVPEGFTNMNAPAEPAPEVVETPPSPPTSVAAAATSAEDLREAQRLLNDLGYEAGPADGVEGPRTRTAIANFQRDSLLVDTGRLNRATLVVLRYVVENPARVETYDEEESAGGRSSGGASGGDGRGDDGRSGEYSSKTLTEEDIRAIEQMLRRSGMRESQIRRRIEQIRASQRD